MVSNVALTLLCITNYSIKKSYYDRRGVSVAVFLLGLSEPLGIVRNVYLAVLLIGKQNNNLQNQLVSYICNTKWFRKYG